MNGAKAKKLRREARRMLRGATVKRLAWWAHPRIFPLWTWPVTWFAEVAYRCGWSAPARQWLAILTSPGGVGVRREPVHVMTPAGGR